MDELQILLVSFLGPPQLLRSGLAFDLSGDTDDE
jgi:hypothetical protein